MNWTIQHLKSFHEWTDDEIVYGEKETHNSEDLELLGNKHLFANECFQLLLKYSKTLNKFKDNFECDFFCYDKVEEKHQDKMVHVFLKKNDVYYDFNQEDDKKILSELQSNLFSEKLALARGSFFNDDGIFIFFETKKLLEKLNKGK